MISTNILFPMLSYTEMAMDDIPPDNPVQKELNQVLKAIYRARDLVSRFSPSVGTAPRI